MSGVIRDARGGDLPGLLTITGLSIPAYYLYLRDQHEYTMLPSPLANTFDGRLRTTPRVTCVIKAVAAQYSHLSSAFIE